MKKLSALAGIILAGGIIAGASNFANKDFEAGRNNNTVAVATTNDTRAEEFAAIYDELELDEAGLNEDAYEKAVTGLEKLAGKGKLKNDGILTIVDFSQPSNKKRLYVIDLENKRVLFNTLVAHGKNTGTLWARSFSNQMSSLKSSPGFYVTAETYYGDNGYSLRLDGMEKNINSNARTRAIVMHGAPYVNQSAVNGMGYIGRSWGCPAVPMKEHKQIINTIRNGTCLFIYSPNEDYLGRSTVLNA